MVTKEEEARSLCAYSNLVKDCSMCYDLEHIKGTDYVTFYVDCEGWRMWLVEYKKPLKIKVKELLDKAVSKLHTFWTV